MKLLILDSSSMVGHVMALYMKEQGHEVIGYDEVLFRNVNTVIGSLYDTSKLDELIDDGDYDAIINCAAITNQEAEADKAIATFINAYLPHYLEKITEGTKTIVVNRSTDCIFSGKRGQYTTDDRPDAESFYARTKMLGEVVNEKDITIRTSLIGPEYEKDGKGLFNWFFNQKGEVKGFANAIWTGLTTIEFAREIETLLMKRAHGLFQLVPDYSVGKYELLIMFEKNFPGKRNIRRIENERVDKSLVQIINGYGLIVPDYDSQIREMKTWIENHRDLYINY